MSDIKDNTGGKINKITEGLTEKAGGLTKGLSSKASEISEGLSSKTSEISEGITNKASEITEGISEGISNKTNAVKKELADTTNNIRQSITDKKDAIKTDIAETKQSINTSIDKGKKAASRFVRRLLLALTFLAILAGVLYYLYASMTYSDGSRTGQLIKISEKGYVFKTYEGQLSLGGISVEGNETNIGSIWEFSVVNDGIYRRLQELQGQKVKLQYEEKYERIPWRGDTKHIITNVEQSK